MNQYFVIDTRLPGLNELIAANRQGYHAGARLKRDAQTTIMWAITAAKLRPVTLPCIVHMTFEESTRRRDTDNVESAKKFILDALVNTGILQGDGPRHDRLPQLDAVRRYRPGAGDHHRGRERGRAAGEAAKVR